MLATILYEDSQVGPRFALHDLVVRMVADDSMREVFVVGRRLTGVPRAGIDKLLDDLARADRLAGAGWLFLLVDGDRIAEHLIRRRALVAGKVGESEIDTAIHRLAGGFPRLSTFFLEPNLEGVLRAVHRCTGGSQLARLESALRKDRFARDALLEEVRRGDDSARRRCVREAQPGLDLLVRRLAALYATTV